MDKMIWSDNFKEFKDYSMLMNTDFKHGGEGM